MKYQKILPSKPLSNFVRSFWVLEGEASKIHPYRHRIMADGTAELVFHYNGGFNILDSDNKSQTTFTSGLDAQSLKIKRLLAIQDFGLFGVYLYPYTISLLLSIPATELKDQMIDVKTLFGKNEKGLEEKMMLAKNTEERVSVITSFLESRLLKVKTDHLGILKSIKYIIQSKGVVDIGVLADSNFLSRRQFERNFKHFTGFSPKLYSRIIRFQESLKYYGRPHMKLAQIALSSGYTDQSHFIREFKEFADIHPKNIFILLERPTNGKKHRLTLDVAFILFLIRGIL